MKKQLILLIVTISIIVGCGEVHCPAFPMGVAGYLPYEKGDTLNFTNVNHDTLSFHVLDSYKSEDWSFKRNCKCSCGAEYNFRTDTNLAYSGIKVSGGIMINENSSTELNISFSNSNKVETFTIRKVNTDPFLSENSNLFGDTVLLTKTDSDRFNNVKVVKNKGIIQFYDKEKKCNWTLIDKKQYYNFAIML
jgi:hypothetical protein